MIEVVREAMQVESFDGHRVGAFLHRPSAGPAPGLVMIPEIFGINLPLREMAARYASEGFAVLVLDIFSRLERDVDLEYDDPGHAKGRALHKAFDYATGVKDMEAGISFLRAWPECNGKVGVVGFCLGGTMAYLAASRTDVDAAVGYYGTRIHPFTAEGGYQQAADPAFRRAGPHHAARTAAGSDPPRDRREFERAGIRLSEDGACLRQSPPSRHLRRGSDQNGGRAHLRAFPQVACA